MWAPVLTNYRIEEFISQGAFGSVFRAVNLKNQQTVAIKMISNFANHEYHCVQILREIQLMRILNAQQKGSGHVPQLFDLIMSKDAESKDMKIFIVQEYFEYDLRTLIMQNLDEIKPMHVVSIVY